MFGKSPTYPHYPTFSNTDPQSPGKNTGPPIKNPSVHFLYPSSLYCRHKYAKVHETSQIQVNFKYINVHLTDDSGPHMVYLTGTFFVPKDEYMPNFSITPTNLNLLLQLGKSAQYALSTLLKHANGASEVKLDRSSMNDAEKQKLKLGLQELVKLQIISKVPGVRGTYKLDPSIITYSNVHTGTSSHSTSKSPFNTTTTRSEAKKPKEPYGNTPEKQMNFDKLIEKLQHQKEIKERKEKLEKESAEASEKMWAALDTYRQSKPAKLDPVYSSLPGTYTGHLLAACDEFIDEITNETAFYDLDNKIMHDNKLRKQFSGSIKSFDKRYSVPKNWNILIELDAIKSSTKHSRYCLDLASKNEKCTCYEDCHSRFMAILKADIEFAKLDDKSYRDHSDLLDYFHDWVNSKYPELTY